MDGVHKFNILSEKRKNIHSVIMTGKQFEYVLQFEVRNFETRY